MDEVESGKRVLDAERQAVLDGLQQVVQAWDEESARRVVFGGALNLRVRKLLLRGKAAGVPVKEMAAAGGVTRRWARLEIRQAERGAARRGQA